MAGSREARARRCMEKPPEAIDRRGRTFQVRPFVLRKDERDIIPPGLRLDQSANLVDPLFCVDLSHLDESRDVVRLEHEE